MGNEFVDIVLQFAHIGAGCECIVILIDYVLTSLLSMMGRG